MRLFHATDQSCVDSILNRGFTAKKNRYHWLGNGIYFYKDYQLAKWWATNPTKKFGVDITSPAILSVDVNFDQHAVLDLSCLSGYTECINEYNEFSSYVVPALEESVWYDRSALRCSFFDWVFKTCDVSCIIGNFTHRNQKYLMEFSQEAINQLRLFHLPFTETQVCIREGIIQKDGIMVLEVEGC